MAAEIPVEQVPHLVDLSTTYADLNAARDTLVAGSPAAFTNEINTLFSTENVIDEEVAIEEKPEGTKIKIDYNLESSLLCELAKSDCKHDFGGEMVATASIYIPHNEESCNAYPEDTFMHRHIYNKPILANYEHIKVLPTDDLDTVFAERGILDVYLIIDTYSSGLRDQLVKNKNNINPPVKYFWVENRQTQYDPAGKTHPKSGAGKVLFLNNNKLQYVREIIRTNGILYPPWSKGKATIDIRNLEHKNELFYSKNTIFQIAEKMPDRSINTKCIMKLPNNDYVVMDKEMSKISKGLFNSVTYNALYNKLRAYISQYIGPAQNVPADFTDAHHAVAKRLGDQGQALSTLDEIMMLETMNGVGFQTSGNHASVSIDRLAIAAALQYRAPIIIYCRYDGSLDIYIRKDKIGNDEYKKNIQVELKNKQINIYRELYSSINLERIREDITRYNQNYDTLITNLRTAISGQIGATNDSYKTYIKDVFSAIMNINMKPKIIVDDALLTEPLETDENISKLDFDTAQKHVKRIEQLDFIKKQIATLNTTYDIANDKLNTKKINEIRLFNPIRISRNLQTIVNEIIGSSYISFIIDEIKKINNTAVIDLLRTLNARLLNTIKKHIIQSPIYNDRDLKLYLVEHIEEFQLKITTDLYNLLKDEQTIIYDAEIKPEFIITHTSTAISEQTFNENSTAIQQAVPQNVISPASLFTNEGFQGGGKQKGGSSFITINNKYNLFDYATTLVIILLYASINKLKIQGTTISSDNIKTNIQTFIANTNEAIAAQPDITSSNIYYINEVEYMIKSYPELYVLYNYITNIIENKMYNANTTIILNNRLSSILNNLGNISLLNADAQTFLTTFEQTVDTYSIPLFFQSIVHDLVYMINTSTAEEDAARQNSQVLVSNHTLETEIYNNILPKKQTMYTILASYISAELIARNRVMLAQNTKYAALIAELRALERPANSENYTKLPISVLLEKKEDIIKQRLKENKETLEQAKKDARENDTCKLVKKLKHDTNVFAPINNMPIIAFLNKLIKANKLFYQMYAYDIPNQDPALQLPQRFEIPVTAGGSRNHKITRRKYNKKYNRKQLYKSTAYNKYIKQRKTTRVQKNKISTRKYKN